MAFRMFDTGKVPCTCDAMTHMTEKRKDGDTKVVVLTLRVQPFDPKLAVSLHEDVRRTLFKLNHPDPQPHLARVNFQLGIPRQHIDLYATSDTKEATRRLAFVKITGLYARTEKGTTGYALVFKAVFGPASDKELAFCEAWLSTMKFLSFHESEPNADFEEAEPNGDDDDDDEQPSLPDPEFETDGKGKPLDEHEPERARHAAPRHADRKSAAKAKQGRGRR